ncbi:CoA transferase [Streptomyces sp. NPDC005799]|uniref:CoA transferase n=1 Tax=Streptomyces sp. NPDC005799 TaxID=3154678 RepID=UPI00340ADD5F
MSHQEDAGSGRAGGEQSGQGRVGEVDAPCGIGEEAVKILREVFATRTLAEWSERFATLAGPWVPVQDSRQVAADAQVRANEYIVRAGELELVASPVQFHVTAPEVGPAPEFAAQTEEVLMELGLGWERILALKAAGAVT